MTFSLQDVPDASLVDGSLRDLYVLGTGAAEWNALLAWLCAEYPESTRYMIGDHVQSFPSTIEEIHHKVASPFLHVDLSGLALHCHFYTDSDIEFDLDPRELSEARFMALQEFMQKLGRRLNREVRLTPENLPEHRILWYDPKQDCLTNREYPHMNAETRRHPTPLPLQTRSDIIAACEQFLARERFPWMVISVSRVLEHGRRFVSIADPDSPKDRETLIYIEATGQIRWIYQVMDILRDFPPDDPYVRPREPLTPEQAAAACRKVCWFDEKRTRASCVGKDTETGEWLVELTDRRRGMDAMRILVRFNEQTGAAKILRRL